MKLETADQALEHTPMDLEVLVVMEEMVVMVEQSTMPLET